MDMAERDRRELIRQALDSTVQVTDWPPLFRVFLVDLPVWLEEIGAEQLVLKARPGGGVHVDSLGTVGDKLVQVSLTVDAVRGVDVPPPGSGEVARLSVSEVARLASAEAVAS